mgnify:CR=1 FL=1
MQPLNTPALDRASIVMREMLSRAEKAIDTELGVLYARKNPQLLEVVARIGYDEYARLQEASHVNVG